MWVKHESILGCVKKPHQTNQYDRRKIRRRKMSKCPRKNHQRKAGKTLLLPEACAILQQFKKCLGPSFPIENVVFPSPLFSDFVWSSNSLFAALRTTNLVWTQSIGFPTYCRVVTAIENVTSKMTVAFVCNRKIAESIFTWFICGEFVVARWFSRAVNLYGDNWINLKRGEKVGWGERGGRKRGENCVRINLI